MKRYRIKARSDAVHNRFNRMGDYISKRIHDRFSIGSAFWGVFIHTMFTRIYEAYAIKSEGGTDSLGNKWKPLSPNTIAKRPINKQQKNLSKLSLTRKHLKSAQRGLLTPAQNRYWKFVFVQVRNALVKSMDIDKASKIAAGYAWKKVKERGAVTRKDKLSNRKAKIMRETDALFESLKPSKMRGKFTYLPRKSQIVRWNGRGYELGTAIPYAKYHIDTRPAIPEDMEPWIAEAYEKAMEAAVEQAVKSLT